MVRLMRSIVLLLLAGAGMAWLLVTGLNAQARAERSAYEIGRWFADHHR